MGVTAYAVRVLVEGDWSGGKAKPMADVLKMTPDQVWLSLCEMDMLKHPVGSRRATMPALAAAGRVSRAATAEGTTVPVRASGKSRAQQLAEQNKTSDKTPEQVRDELEAIGMPPATVERMVATRQAEVDAERRKAARKKKGIV